MLQIPLRQPLLTQSLVFHDHLGIPHTPIKVETYKNFRKNIILVGVINPSYQVISNSGWYLTYICTDTLTTDVCVYKQSLPTFHDKYLQGSQ